MPKIEQSQQQFQIYREKYEKMRNDVSVKLKFLEENKVGQWLVVDNVSMLCSGVLIISLYFFAAFFHR